MRRFLMLIIIILVGIGLISGCTTASKKKVENKVEQAENTVKKAAETTTTDTRTLFNYAKASPQKNGCTSCHTGKKVINGKEVDISLAGETKVVKTSNGGAHPDVAPGTTLKQCVACHKTLKVYDKFVNAVHKVHSQSKVFRPKYKADCTSCHAIKDNGLIILKGLT